MRRAVALVALALAIAGRCHSADAACVPDGADAADVAAARAAIAAGCDCAPRLHGVYVKCARATARATLQNRGCLGAVVRCAARSTCGRPAAVVCCLTNAEGRTRGMIEASAAACHPPAHGSACVGSGTSVCDACDAAGCVNTTTTSTTQPPVCGNGIIENGEFCDGGPGLCQEFFAQCLGCVSCCFTDICADFPIAPGGLPFPCCNGAPCLPSPLVPPPAGLCAF